MTRQPRLFASLFFLAALTAALSVRAETLGPGTYYGYFSVTRWGQKVFHKGPYHLFVSDSAAQVLEKHRGKPLELKVSKISQSMISGADRIDGIAGVTEKGIARGLVLSARLKSKSVFQGQGVLLHLSLRNDSEETITILPGTLAIALATNSPFSNKEIGYKHPDDCSYWYYSAGDYSQRYLSREKDKMPLHIACREIVLSWTARDLVSKGHNIHEAAIHESGKDRGFGNPVVVEPRGRFEAEYVVGKELLPDEYEVFFYLTSRNFSYVPGPMSDRLPFDVIAPKQEPQTAEPNAPAGAQEPRR